MSIYKVYGLTLVPKDKDKIVPPYNKKYPNRVPVSNSIFEQQAGKELYDFEFVFKNGNEEFIYVVERDSIMIVRSKKSAARIPKISSSGNALEEVDSRETSLDSSEDYEVLPMKSWNS